MDDIADLAPAVRAAASETERERRLPEALLEQLRRAGCLRMWAPRAYGGDELALPESLRVVRELARADGAAGWVVGQLAMAQAVLGRFPRRVLDQWYADGPDALGAGAVAPKGKARPRGAGWQASGQWPFVTGSRHARFFYGQCLALTDSEPAVGAGGLPPLRTVLLPMADTEIVDTWATLGLRGTGSHDVRLRTTELAPDQVITLVGATATVDHPLGRVSTVDLSGLVVAASLVGIGLGAADDLSNLALNGRRSSFGRTPLAENDEFRQRLGQAYTEIRAVAALLDEVADRTWQQALRGRPRTLVERGLTRAVARQAALVTVSAVSLMYGQAGGSSIYDDSDLQHRLRDVHTAAQHGVAGSNSSSILGGCLVQVLDPALEW